MKVLLDECIDRRIARGLPGHDVETVRGLGWASLNDSELLRQASGKFDAFVTVDRGIPFQQNVAALDLAVVVIRARRNTRTALAPVIPELMRALERCERGTVVWIGDR